ncbi:fibroblast growth factor receptor 3 [Lingula anatina]|uniref:Fibroblast growth factor receptor 3 n=1 Tax=Lingula anatina TaxID=7574 RepID=A0A1S3HH19_LINAN|nr:fibroblast growth factor receptor 3 [Lingula anatina]|eukprot:XP_013385322.1 fibroblast growth factor receptor 3 [Lingula anatina]
MNMESCRGAKGLLLLTIVTGLVLTTFAVRGEEFSSFFDSPSAVCAVRPGGNFSATENQETLNFTWTDLPGYSITVKEWVAIKQNCSMTVYVQVDQFIPVDPGLFETVCNYTSPSHPGHLALPFKLLKGSSVSPPQNASNYPFPVSLWGSRNAIFEITVPVFGVNTFVDCPVKLGFTALRGAFKTHVLGCPENKYGRYCNKNCPRCSIGGYCHTFYGGCVCLKGWSGATCDRVTPMLEVTSSANGAVKQKERIQFNCNIFPSSLETNTTIRWLMNSQNMSDDAFVIHKTGNRSIIFPKGIHTTGDQNVTCIASTTSGQILSTTYVVYVEGHETTTEANTVLPTSDDVATNDGVVPAEPEGGTSTGQEEPNYGVRQQNNDVPVLITFAMIALAVLIVAAIITTIVVTHKMRGSTKRIFTPSDMYAEYHTYLQNLIFSGDEDASILDNQEYLLQKWQVPNNELFVGEILGEGEFSQVFNGHIQWKQTQMLYVAVKMLKDPKNLQSQKDLLAEFQTLSELCPHPNVVQLIGVCNRRFGNDDYRCLVMENMAGGNLKTLLQDIKDGRELSVKPKNVSRIVVDILAAMKHLEEKKVVHRDLAARNVLLTSDLRAKIGDFGLSRDTYLCGNYRMADSHGKRLPWYWMAIESMENGEFTSKSDVWAFGILLWEIGALGSLPYPGVDPVDLLVLLNKGYRMQKPICTSNEWFAIMMECWGKNPDGRPAFSSLYHHFKEMHSSKKGFPYLPMSSPQQIENSYLTILPE